MTPREHADATRQVILRMDPALGADPDRVKEHFHDGVRWIGNQGRSAKPVPDGFCNGFRLPLQVAFDTRTAITLKPHEA